MASQLPEGSPMPEDGRLAVEGNVTDPVNMSAYVHIPFCTVRCGYCDFNTYTAQELDGVSQKSYATELLREIEMSQKILRQAHIETHPLTSVFFGGGTPTLLPAAHLIKILKELEGTYSFSDDIEITVEANPDTLDERYADQLAQAGFTRVSIGMQSTSPHVLKTLDRTHNPANVHRAVKASRQAGLDVSVDVIYGTPGESLSDWEQTLQEVLSLETDHVSAYSLIVEEGTALQRRIQRGEIEPPDDDTNADMYEATDRVLTAAGYSWYEISNWAKNKKFHSRHNLAYWKNANWWGFGPGAHSHILGQRFWNVKHPAAYTQRLAQGLSPSHSGEVLSEQQKELENLMLSLRLRDGIEPSLVPEHVKQELLDEGLVFEDSNLVLTLSGRLRADEILRRIAF